MAAMPQQPEAFSEQVLAIVKRSFPERNAALVGPLDLVIDGRHLGLENLYRMVLRDPQNGVEIVENYLDRLMEGDTVSNAAIPFAMARPRIMPRIQPESIFRQLDREQVAHVPFVNGTVIVFVGASEIRINPAGLVFVSLPTSDPAVPGALWNDAGTVKVSAG